MKATKILNIVFGILSVLSCVFSLYILGSGLQSYFAGGDTLWVLALFIGVIAVYHYLALAVIAVPFIVTCVLAKKYRVNILFFIISFGLALLLNGALLIFIRFL